MKPMQKYCRRIPSLHCLHPHQQVILSDWGPDCLAASPGCDSTGAGSISPFNSILLPSSFSIALRWRHPHARTFASSVIRDDSTSISGQTTSEVSSDERVRIAARVLQQAQILRLRDDLEDISRSSIHIPYSQTLEMAIASGAACSPAEAEEVVAVLHNAGVVLRHHDTVYLHPAEIAEQVMQLLPGGLEDSTRKLQKVEDELALLNAQELKHEASANRVTNVFLSIGFVILATQLGAFVWLTWWELSWDVMEPFGYVIQLFYSLVAYSYFLATRGVFDLDPLRRSWHTHFKNKSIREFQFDEGRYEHLHRLRDRYKRHMIKGTTSTRL